MKIIMAKKDWDWHPNPRQRCEPRECLAAFVRLHPGYVRREQRNGDRNVQESNSNKHLERKTLHGPNEKELSDRHRDRTRL